MTALASEFESFELNHSLFDIQIEDIPIWERIRFHVFRQIERQNGAGQAHTDVGNDWRDYVRGIGLFLKNLFVKNPYFTDESDILYVGHHRRKKREDGLWWDIYCDPIHESCEHDYVHFENDYLLEHNQPAKTSNLRYLDLIEYGGHIQRVLGFNEPEIPQSAQDQLEVASEKIRERFDADVDLVSMAREALHERRTTLPLYRRLLDLVDPKIAVIVVSYGRETFVEACKEQGIPVAELQHGVIYNHHLGYSYPGPRTKDAFPDYFLSFGDFWADSVELPIPDDHIISIGYPFLEESIAQYENIQSTEQLLFISQGTIGEQLSKFAIEVNRYPEIHHDVVYKLHPGEYDRWKDEYPWLADADFEIVGDSDSQLYKLFAESSAQIGVGSTAVYEGLAFGLETFVYDCPGSEVLQPLVDDGSASRISSIQELTHKLDSSQNSSFDRSYYFKPNATARAHKAIEQLM